MNIKCENFVSAYSPASVKDRAGRLTYIRAMTRSTGESPKCCKSSRAECNKRRPPNVMKARRH